MNFVWPHSSPAKCCTRSIEDGQPSKRLQFAAAHLECSCVVHRPHHHVVILGCVLVVGIACLSLHRYRQSGRSDPNSVRANSLVHGISNVDAMSISTIHSGQSHDSAQQWG